MKGLLCLLIFGVSCLQTAHADPPAVPRLQKFKYKIRISSQRNLVFPLLTQETFIYSQQSDDKGCRGKHIYFRNLKSDKLKLLELNCIQKLWLSGEQLWVIYSEQSETRFATIIWKGLKKPNLLKRFKHFFTKNRQECLLTARTYAALIANGNNQDIKSLRVNRFFTVHAGRLYVASEVHALGARYLFIDQFETATEKAILKNELFVSKDIKTPISDISVATVDKKPVIYIIHRGVESTRAKLGGLNQYSIENKQVKFQQSWFVKAVPPTASEFSKEKFSLFAPRFFTQSAEGFFVLETTDLGFYTRQLIYYHAPSGKFYGIPFLSGDGASILGLSESPHGLVVSEEAVGGVYLYSNNRSFFDRRGDEVIWP